MYSPRAFWLLFPPFPRFPSQFRPGYFRLLVGGFGRCDRRQDGHYCRERAWALEPLHGPRGADRGGSHRPNRRVRGADPGQPAEGSGRGEATADQRGVAGRPLPHHRESGEGRATRRAGSRTAQDGLPTWKEDAVTGAGEEVTGRIADVIMVQCGRGSTEELAERGTIVMLAGRSTVSARGKPRFAFTV